MSQRKTSVRSANAVLPGAPDPKKSGKPNPAAGWKGDVSHPKAPSGAGGPGGFVIPGVEKSEDHSRRLRVLDSSHIQLSSAGRAQNPPPVTVPGRKTVTVRKTKSEDIEVYVEVLADSVSSDPALQGAKTSFDSSGVQYQTPGYSYTERRGRKIVTDLVEPYTLKGTITVQTVYGPGAKPDDHSVYGRGTTKKDKARGNTSLGFHEYCHQQDFLEFLRRNKLPEFTGRVGQTEAAFQKAAALVGKQLNKYWQNMSSFSERRTDEVGKKRSQCLKDGRC